MDPRREYSTWNAHHSSNDYHHQHSNPDSREHSPHHQASGSTGNAATWSASGLNWHNNSNSHSHSHTHNHYSTATQSLPPLMHSHSYPLHHSQSLYHPSSSASSPSASSSHYSYVPAAAPHSIAPSNILASSASASSSTRPAMVRVSTDPASTSQDSSNNDSTSGQAKAKRKQVKNACQSCQKACKRCDSGRPCARCVKYGLQDTCRDSVRKERQKGIKRGPYKRHGKNGGKTTQQGAYQRPSETSTQLMAPKTEENGHQHQSYQGNSASISPHQQNSNLGNSQQSHDHHDHHDSNEAFSPMSAPASVQRFSVNMSLNSPADRAIYERMSKDYGSGNLGGNGSSSALGLHSYHSQGHSVSAHSSPSLGAHPVPHSASLMAHAHPLPSPVSMASWGSHDRSISMPIVPQTAPLLSPHSLHNRCPSNGYGSSQQHSQASHHHQSNPILPSLSGGLSSNSSSSGGWPSNSLFSASHPSNAGLFQQQQQHSASPSPHHQQHGFANGVNLYSSSPLNHNGSNLSASSSFFGGHQRLMSEPNFYQNQSSASNHGSSHNSNYGATSSASSVPPLSAHSTSSNSTVTSARSNGSLSPRTPITSLPTASPASQSTSHPLHIHSHVQQLGNEVVPAIGGPKPFVLKMGGGIRGRSSTTTSTASANTIAEETA